MKPSALLATLQSRFETALLSIEEKNGEITCEVKNEDLKKVALALRDEAPFSFDTLMDVCGVDYLHYGACEWTSDTATTTGFSRAVQTDLATASTWTKPRFASVVHLLSVKENHRVRLRVFVDEADMMVDSVVDVWSSANWFEREAFDLFGILYKGHPDLRRILTDYGFQGHPFRKDFPLIGEVEVRYDAKEGRVVNEPVSIAPRTLVPKVIRDDHRYVNLEPKKEGA